MADTNTYLTRWLYRFLRLFDISGSGVILRSTTSAATGANTDETDLWSDTIPANTLATNGQAIRVRAWVNTAANANLKTVKLYFGGVVVAGNVARATNNGTYYVEMLVLRTGASAQVGMGFWSDATACVANAPASLASDTTATITVKVTGTNGSANANDIVFKGAMVELL